MIESIIVNSKRKAEMIINRLKVNKRRAYYETFIDDMLKASYVVVYRTKEVRK